MGSLQDIKGNFRDHGILDFTPGEVVRTGADLKDVRVLLFCALQEFRTKLNRRVHLIFNGLTTGNHSAEEHPNGLAVDFHLNAGDGPVDSTTIRMVLLYAILTGFRGIGIYWNGQAYSFHLDLREDPRFAAWKGTKPAPGVGSWKMETIFGISRNILFHK